jgi:hypothetical protein
MPEKPSLMTRFCAVISGEVSAETLEAYRRASLPVFELLEQVEQARLTARAEGKTAWMLTPGEKAVGACTWNAFVLQTLGNAFLDADYQTHPNTVGFVPPITADQVMSFYEPVEPWLRRARQAQANPQFVLDVSVPAPIPTWSEVEPCPNTHLKGMLHAMRAVRDHAQAAMNFLEASEPTDPKQKKQLDTIRQHFAAATTQARYADDMHGTDPSRDVHERVEEHLKAAIERFYLVGQLVALPECADTPKIKVAVPVSAPPAVLPLPGQPGFNPWVLTDPLSREKFQRDPEAQEAIRLMWFHDPDPARTLAIQAEIDAAYTRGDISIAKKADGNRIGHFFCTPWAAIYMANRPVTLGGIHVSPLQTFVYDVSIEGMNRGVPFRRQLKIARFAPTSELEYGDPNEAPDH